MRVYYDLFLRLCFTKQLSFADHIAYAVSLSVITQAGLTDKVKLIHEPSSAYLQSLKGSKMVFDLVLLDHIKDLYKHDVELLLVR